MNAPKLIACIAATFALAACDQSKDGQTVGQKVGSEVDKAVTSAQTAAKDVEQSAKQGINDAAQASKEKSDQMAKAMSDMAITTAINADLAKDKELSALRINVDTKDRHVTLYGSAPNAAAKQRAQDIAMAEKGVAGVDNKLTVETR